MMNARIQQLALQASENYDYHPEFAKKFAELIVRECARVAEKEQAYNDGHEIHVNIDQCILIEFGL